MICCPIMCFIVTTTAHAAAAPAATSHLDWIDRGILCNRRHQCVKVDIAEVESFFGPGDYFIMSRRVVMIRFVILNVKKKFLILLFLPFPSASCACAINSVGNPRDLLVRNTDFSVYFSSIQGMTFLNISR